MTSIEVDPAVLADAKGKTVIVTGGANGIGAEIVRLFCAHGAQVMIADLPSSSDSAQALIRSFPEPKKVAFCAANTVDWTAMKGLFRQTRLEFGQIDVVVCNAGIMESRPFFEFETIDDELVENNDIARVIDVNVKGTMNTLRLAMFHMSSNPIQPSGFRGSIVLVASTSGYFGGTAVVSYVTSKHGVIGLLRSAQAASQQLRVRLNAAAPSPTPTFITEAYSERWQSRGLPANTASGVARCISHISLNTKLTSCCPLIIGNQMIEVERSCAETVATSMGPEVQAFMRAAGEFFEDIGGYPLPKSRF